jgi:hypothetical protein
MDRQQWFDLIFDDSTSFDTLRNVEGAAETINQGLKLAGTKSKYMTPVGYAIRHHRVDTLRILLQFGADPEKVCFFKLVGRTKNRVCLPIGNFEC